MFMKKRIKILAVAFFTTGFAKAQDLNSANVPENLKNAFNKQYPKATDAEWKSNASLRIDTTLK